MNADFPRILTLLRKEKRISQKKAAEALGVSQALLSHYEKGIRECGLDFVVRSARFYGVSADYMLGLSPDRSGLTISVDELPEESAAGKENVFKGSMLPILNKKLIINSLNVVFSMLQKVGSKELTMDVSNFLMLSVYKMFRRLYSLNENNNDKFFTVHKALAQKSATAEMMLCEAKIEDLKDTVDDLNTEVLELTTEKLNSEYPLFSASLTNLIKSSEASFPKE